MRIVRKTINTEPEKIIVTGLITSDKFIKIVEPFLKKSISMLQTSYGRIVINWCLDYYNKYHVAPKKNIQQIYKNKKEEVDEETLEIIGELLNGLSENYSREANYNEEYAIDQSLSYLNEIKLDDLLDKIKEAKEKKQFDKANGLIREYKKLEKTSYVPIDVFREIDKVVSLMNEEKDGLFSFPGALGELLGPADRGDLIGVAAPSKRGKTFWLIEFGIRLSMIPLRVAYFNLEMSNKKMVIRIYQNVLGELKYVNSKIKKIVKIPYFEEDEEKEGKYNIKYNEIEKRGLNDETVGNKAKAMNTLAHSGRFKLFCIPNSAVTIEQLDEHVSALVTNENFIPDVIIIDYADIIKPSFKEDHRNQIDHTWRNLRKMADEKHCLVITASHCNKKTLEKDIRQGDLSEDSRKLNHVSLMFALNQNKRDRELGMMRISVLASRYEDFQVENEVVVAQNLAIGKPFLDSRWKRDVLSYRKKI